MSTIMPPSFNFKGDRNKSISLKSQAAQYYQFFTKQAELGGVNQLNRTVVLNDGSLIKLSIYKDDIYDIQKGFVTIVTSTTSSLKEKKEKLSIVYFYDDLGIPSRRPDGVIYVGGDVQYLANPSATYPKFKNFSVDTSKLKSNLTYQKIAEIENNSVYFNNDYRYYIKTPPIKRSIICDLLISAFPLKYGAIVAYAINNVDLSSYSITIDKVTDTDTTTLCSFNLQNSSGSIALLYNGSSNIICNNYPSVTGTVLDAPPLVLHSDFSPDGKYLSIILVNSVNETLRDYLGDEFTSIPSPAFLFTDIIVKFDYDVLKTYDDQVIKIYQESPKSSNTPNKTEYSSIIQNDFTVYVHRFLGVNFVEEKRRITDVGKQWGTLFYNCAVDTLIHREGESVLHRGSYESDFQSYWATNNPDKTITSISYDYTITDLDPDTTYSDDYCFSKATVSYTKDGNPSSEEVSVGQGFVGFTGYKGDYFEDLRVISEGSCVSGIVYSNERYEEGPIGEFKREWYDTKINLIDNSTGLKVSDGNVIKETYDIIHFSGANDFVANDYRETSSAEVNEHVYRDRVATRNVSVTNDVEIDTTLVGRHVLKVYDTNLTTRVDIVVRGDSVFPKYEYLIDYSPSKPSLSQHLKHKNSGDTLGSFNGYRRRYSTSNPIDTVSVKSLSSYWYDKTDALFIHPDQSIAYPNGQQVTYTKSREFQGVVEISNYPSTPFHVDYISEVRTLGPMSIPTVSSTAGKKEGFIHKPVSMVTYAIDLLSTEDLSEVKSPLTSVILHTLDDIQSNETQIYYLNDDLYVAFVKYTISVGYSPNVDGARYDLIINGSRLETPVNVPSSFWLTGNRGCGIGFTI